MLCSLLTLHDCIRVLTYRPTDQIAAHVKKSMYHGDLTRGNPSNDNTVQLVSISQRNPTAAFHDI